ncbi:MAG TPA: septal ring lytic transglycosylase RlpA family protein [Bryobacteraceae bacterium]|nr:septal ring lytic transglycosylase RlpA family protein [Bryobacteraceae bacterium]
MIRTICAVALPLALLAGDAGKPSAINYRVTSVRASVPAPQTKVEAPTVPASFAPQTGTACYLGQESGGLTATHPTLPVGSKAAVTRVSTGKAVVVTVTARARFSGDRIVGLSYDAARELGFVSSGTTTVRIEAAPTSTLK